MAYTGHGHQIENTPVQGKQPKQRSRCGGPGICDPCSREASRKQFGQFLADWREEGEMYLDAVLDYNYKVLFNGNAPDVVRWLQTHPETEEPNRGVYISNTTAFMSIEDYLKAHELDVRMESAPDFVIIGSAYQPIFRGTPAQAINWLERAKAGMNLDSKSVYVSEQQRWISVREFLEGSWR